MTNNTITIIVNGKHRNVPEHMSLTQFLDSLSLQSRFIAVGYNGDVLQKEAYATAFMSFALVFMNIYGYFSWLK